MRNISTIISEATGPARISTGSGKATVTNPAHSDTATYEGDPAQYTFGAQTRNYTALQTALTRNGKPLTYIAVAKSPLGRDTFVATAPGVVWYKYESGSPQAGQNSLYINGVKDKLSSFLALSPDDQDSMLSISTEDLHLKNRDVISYINSLATSALSADSIKAKLEQNKDTLLELFASRIAQYPELIKKVKTFNKALAKKGALVPWLATDNLLNVIQPYIANKFVNELISWPDHMFKHFNHAIDEGIITTFKYFTPLINDNIQEITNQLTKFRNFLTYGGKSTINEVFEFFKIVGYSNPDVTIENIVNNIPLEDIGNHLTYYSSENRLSYAVTSMRFSEIPIDVIKNALTAFKRNLITIGINKFYESNRVDYIADLSDAIHQVGLDWPELQGNRLRNTINDHKREIITAILTDMKNSDFERPLAAANYFIDNGYNWPEMTAIKRSATASLNNKQDMSEQDSTGDTMNINEDLGNLAQLNVGPLINVLKQQPAYQNRRRDYNSGSVGSIGNKFYNDWNMPFGTNSPIVDIGSLKDGMKALRKAFKTHETAAAFAVYIGGKAAMFGVTDSETLAGSSREGRIAYDFRPWDDAITAAHERENAGKSSWQRSSKPELTTIHSVTGRDYGHKDDSYNNPIMSTKHYAGNMISTNSLSALFTIMQHISVETKQPLTGKIVLRDIASGEKRQARRRLSQTAIDNGAKDLTTRLAIYKNSKKPSANTIEEFIALSLKKPGSVVQFAGRSYKLEASSYEKIDPLGLLNGKSFTTSYKTNDPNSYESLTITYRYDAETNQLLPITATWSDKNKLDTTTSSSQTAVLDAAGFIKNALQVRKLDKHLVIPKILDNVKRSQFKNVLLQLSALKKLGLDWPEISVIERSVQAEMNKK